MNDQTINDSSVNEGGGLQLTERIGNAISNTELGISKQHTEIIGIVNSIVVAPIFVIVLSAVVSTRDTINTAALYARTRTETSTTVVTTTIVPSKIHNFITGSIQNTSLTASKLVSGTIATVDTANLFVTKPVSTVISITDNIIYNITRSVILTEVLTVIHGFERTLLLSVQPVELVAPVDTTRFTMSKLNTETIRVFNRTNFESDLALIEQFAGIENVSELGAVKQLSETVSIIDTITRKALRLQSLSEAINTIDTIQQNVRIVRVLTESVARIDTVMSGITKTVSKNISIRDTFTMLAIRPTREVIGVGSIVSTIGRFRIILKQLVNVTGDANSAVTKSQTATLQITGESITIIRIRETVRETLGTVKSIRTVAVIKLQLETIVGLIDTINSIANIEQLLAETVGSIETSIQIAAIKIQLDKVIGLIEQARTPVTYQSKLVEVIGIVENTNVKLRNIRMETFAISSNISKLGVRIVRNQFISPVNNINAIADIRVQLDEIAGIVDDTITVANYQQEFAEVITTLDRVTNLPVKQFSKRITVIEQTKLNKSIAHTIVEIVGLIDTTSLTLKQAVIEIIGGIENITELLTSKVQQQTVGVVDTIQFKRLKFNSITETVSIIDKTTLKSTKNLSRVVTTTEQVRSSTIITQTLSEVVSIISTVELGVRKTITETIQQTESITQLGVHKLQEKNVASIDTVQILTASRIVLDEIVGTIDEVSTTITYRLEFSERLTTVNEAIVLPVKYVSQTVTVVEKIQVSAGIRETLEEIVGLIDRTSVTIRQIRVEVLGEVVNISQIGIRKVQQERIGVAGIVDTAVREIQILVETVSIVNKKSIRVTKLQSKIITTVETVSAAKTFVLLSKTLSQTISIVDELSTGSKTIQLLVETIAIVDNRTSNTIKAINEIQAGQITRISNTLKLQTMTVSVVDEINRNRRVLVELIETISIITKRRTEISKQLVNAFGAVNTLNLNITTVKTQVSTIDYTIVTPKILTASIEETVAIIDNTTADIRKRLSEIDSIQTTILSGVRKTIVEVVMIVGQAQAGNLLQSDLVNFTVTKSQSNTIGSQNRIRMIPTKVLSKTIQIIDVRVGSQFSIQTISKALGLSPTRQSRVTKPLSSSVNSVATIRLRATKILDDLAGIIDSTVQNAGIIRSLKEVIASREATGLSSGKVVSVVGVSVAGIRHNPMKRLRETTGFITQFTAITRVSVVITETIAIIDEITASGEFMRILTETVIVDQTSIRSIKSVLTESIIIDSEKILSISKALSKSVIFVKTVFAGYINFFRATMVEIVGITEEKQFAIRKQVITVIRIKTEVGVLRIIIVIVEEVITTVDQITIVKRVFEFIGLERVTNIAQYEELGEFAESVKSLIDIDTKAENKED